MKKFVLLAGLVVVSMVTSKPAMAQSGILAEMYGEGVHAYNNHNFEDAKKYLTMAINGGMNDPRAFYFRGIVSYMSGNLLEADADWQAGADIEAKGSSNPLIGRALTRFQGPGRLKLEEIRQQARLQALAMRAARMREQNQTTPLPFDTPPPAPPVVPDSKAATQPPTPPPAQTPFADAQGDAEVTSDDALKGTLDDPFAGEPADGAAPAGDTADPFAETDTSDPFGEPSADDSDPFGEPAADDSDPFGEDSDDSDPFAEPDDPFSS